MNLSAEKGAFLVRFARDVIEAHLLSGRILAPPKEKWLSEKQGVFVTLHTFPEKDLRGCIGFAEPHYSLGEGLIRAALAAAFKDLRFPPITVRELEKIVVEVSVLSKPQKIDAGSPEEILSAITPKRDGLILKRGYASGLFLPQVWDELPQKEDFLKNLCYKAGLSDPHAWYAKDSEIYRFTVVAFEEISPRGEITEKKIS